MARWNTVQVCLDLERFVELLSMGSLHRQSARGQEIFSFEVDQSWLEHEEVFAFDPDLALAPGAQYPAPGRSTFGIFLDSSPDRWGRVLMQRRESAHARSAARWNPTPICVPSSSASETAAPCADPRSDFRALLV
jgi:hypothetical protein